MTLSNMRATKLMLYGYRLDETIPGIAEAARLLFEATPKEGLLLEGCWTYNFSKLVCSRRCV